MSFVGIYQQHCGDPTWVLVLVPCSCPCRARARARTSPRIPNKFPHLQNFTVLSPPPYLPLPAKVFFCLFSVPYRPHEGDRTEPIRLTHPFATISANRPYAHSNGDTTSPCPHGGVLTSYRQSHDDAFLRVASNSYWVDIVDCSRQHFCTCPDFLVKSRHVQAR
jgi:hypothetical protein